MVTHARARFLFIEGVQGLLSLESPLTPLTSQPWPALPFRPLTLSGQAVLGLGDTRRQYSRYHASGKSPFLQRLIPSRSAASVSTSSEHQRSRIALSRLKQTARGSPQTRRRNLFLAIGAISFFKIEPFPALRLRAPVGTGSSARRWLIGHLCTSTAGLLLAGWGLLNNHSVRAGAEASGGCRD